MSRHQLVLPLLDLVHAEIVAVTSAMRKNARWSGNVSPYASTRSSITTTSNIGLRRGPSIQETRTRDDPSREVNLFDGFEALKRELRGTPDVSLMPITTLLDPFLAVIRSPSSTGPIAAITLSSLSAFFTYGLITPSSNAFRPAMTTLSSTLSHLKFEANESSGDEVVLLRMLNVIEECMKSSVGPELGDVEVCELLEAVLTICCQTRLSDVLRKSAENTMSSLVRIVFARLKDLDPVASEQRLKDDEEAEAARACAVEEAAAIVQASSEEADGATTPTSSSHAIPVPENIEIQVPSLPYGLLSIRELLRVVINLLDPADQTHTDTIRLTALGILRASLEVSGTYIPSFPSLSTLITDKGCKYLFQLSRSDNTLVLGRSLRIISNLFDMMPQDLKLQTELFLSVTLDRLTLALTSPSGGTASTPNVQLRVGGVGALGPKAGPRPSSAASHTSPDPNGDRKHSFDNHTEVTSSSTVADNEEDEEGSTISNPPTPRPGILPALGEARALLLETLGHLARQPHFMADLWVNYDCDLDCEDLFERMIGFLTRGVYSTQHGSSQGSNPLQHSQLLCLDLLLTFVGHMSSRLESPSPEWPSDAPSVASLNQRRARKKILLTGYSRFNTKPKLGLAYLEEKGLLYPSDSGESRVVSLARFLKNSPRLDKKLLGEYISKGENLELLRAFIGLFDFRKKSMSEAMRELLEAFRLPGESQPIERITSTFAECFYAAGPAEIRSQDAVFVLAYAVIMLNTDQHSRNVRHRMTIEDFKRNLRGVNEDPNNKELGSDFAPEYLQSIYDDIRKQEIIMPVEHTGQAGFDFAWRELMQRSKNAEPLIICNTDVFDEALFRLSWKPIVSSIASAFTTFDDEYIVQSVIAGFRQCATLAGRYYLPEVFDYIVMSLSHATELLNESGAFASPVFNFPTVEVDGRTVTVSSLSIKLGTSFRSQLAAIVLFTIANGNGNAIRDGWTQIFEMFQTLFLHSLLPTRMLQTEDFLGGVSMIPMQGNVSTPMQPPGRSDGGLLSALSSYLMTPYNNAPEPVIPEVTESDIESTLSAIDCIGECRLHELYTQIMHLELDALVAAVKALVDLADQRTVRLLESIEAAESSLRPDPRPRQLAYDPASVFLLETMVSITVQTPDHIEEIWPLVFHHITGLLTSATRFSILLIERVVVGLLRIALILASRPNLRDQLYIALDLLGSLPPLIMSSVADQLTAGVALIIKEHRDVINSTTEWGLIFSLLRGTTSHHSAGPVSFDIIAGLVQSINEDPNYRLENLAGIVAILEEFAALPGRAIERKRGRKPTQTPNTPQPPDPTVERAVKAIELLYSLKKSIPRLVDQASISKDDAWVAGWSPLLVALGRQSSSLSPDVRNIALSHMQRILLGPQISAQGYEVIDVPYLFDRIIFPMVDDMLRADLDTPRSAAISELRLRASALLCKSFLHFAIRPTFSGDAQLRDLWLIILDFLDRLMHSGGQRDQLFEAVPESLKNVLLVMETSDLLVPPPLTPEDSRDERQKQLWEDTLDRIDQFLPGFLLHVIPPPPPPTPPQPSQPELPHPQPSPREATSPPQVSS